MHPAPLPWKCPKCSSNILIEAGAGHIKSRVAGLHKGQIVIGKVEEVDNRLVAVRAFECGGCGQSVKDGRKPITNRKDLAAWLTRSQ